MATTKVSILKNGDDKIRQIPHLKLLFCICSPNAWVLISGVGVSCWMSPSASRAPGVFMARLCLDQSSCRYVIDVMLLGCVYCARLIRAGITVCSVSFLLLLSKYILDLRPQLSHWSLQHQSVQRPNLQGVFSVFRGAGACGVAEAIYK